MSLPIGSGAVTWWVTAGGCAVSTAHCHLLWLSLMGFSIIEMLVFWARGGAELLWQVKHRGCPYEHSGPLHWGREAALPAALGSWSRRGEMLVKIHS